MQLWDDLSFPLEASNNPLEASSDSLNGLTTVSYVLSCFIKGSLGYAKGDLGLIE